MSCVVLAKIYLLCPSHSRLTFFWPAKTSCRHCFAYNTRKPSHTPPKTKNQSKKQYQTHKFNMPETKETTDAMKQSLDHVLSSHELSTPRKSYGFYDDDTLPTVSPSVCSSSIACSTRTSSHVQVEQLSDFATSCSLEDRHDSDNENSDHVDDSSCSTQMEDVIVSKEPTTETMDDNLIIHNNSTTGPNDSSINLGILIGHMQVLQSLEDLTNFKASRTSILKASRRVKDRNLRARLHLLVAHENDCMDEFQRCYELSKEDVETIATHVRLCSECNEDIRWSTIFQILFPDPQQNERIWDPLESLVQLALEEVDEE